MIKNIVIILMCLSMISGCQKKGEVVGNPHVTSLSTPSPTPLSEVAVEKPKFLLVGDSITEGTFVSSYPSELQKLVGEDFAVLNFGVSGSSAADSAQFPYRSTGAYEKSLQQENVISIVLMFGTNDTSVNSWINRDSFKIAYIDLVDDYLQSYPDAKLYLCTISQAFYLEGHQEGEAEYGIQPDIIVIVNEVVHEVANEYQLPLIDVFALTNANSPWFFDDGIHPNADGNVAIANLVYQTITSD